MLDFRQTKFLLSAAESGQFPPDRGGEVAIAGRSNVGKSSALNTLADQKSLARTSKTPGRTQLINFFAVDAMHRLVDLPGYGYAKVPGKMRRDWQRLIEHYFQARKSLRGIVLVTDARHPLKPFDRQMISWAESLQLPVHVLMTKADKLKKRDLDQNLREIERALPEGHSAQGFSALRRSGVDRARARIESLLRGRT